MGGILEALKAVWQFIWCKKEQEDGLEITVVGPHCEYRRFELVNADDIKLEHERNNPYDGNAIRASYAFHDRWILFGHVSKQDNQNPELLRHIGDGCSVELREIGSNTIVLWVSSGE